MPATPVLETWNENKVYIVMVIINVPRTIFVIWIMMPLTGR